MQMGDLVLTTFDWVPEPPRGFVRDLRVRWALEEAGLAYRVATTPFEAREAATSGAALMLVACATRAFLSGSP